MTRLPAHLDQQIGAELWPDEELVWSGQPQVRSFLMVGILSVPIGGLILAPVLPFFLFNLVAVVIGFVQLFTGEPLGEALAELLFSVMFLLFTLPFAAIGFFLVSQPWWGYLSARRTAYALTNQRAIILAPRFRPSGVRSFPLDDLGKVIRRDHRAGSGDLVFVEAEYSQDEARRRITMRHEKGFVAIRDVDEVEAMIQELRGALN